MKNKLSMAIIVLMLTGCFAFLVPWAVFGSSKASTSGKVYTAYNMWYETNKESSMWAINYKTGNMIPAGTEVVSVEVKRNKINFITVKDKKKYTVNFKAAFHPGKTVEDYAKMMFSEKDIDQLTQGMSETDITGIKEGVIRVGMTKNAVIIAYGYPPEHKTPDLKGNEWRYWMNRFRTNVIYFDESGKTIQPPSQDPGVL